MRNVSVPLASLYLAAQLSGCSFPGSGETIYEEAVQDEVGDALRGAGCEDISRFEFRIEAPDNERLVGDHEKIALDGTYMAIDARNLGAFLEKYGGSRPAIVVPNDFGRIVLGGESDEPWSRNDGSYVLSRVAAGILPFCDAPDETLPQSEHINTRDRGAIQYQRLTNVDGTVQGQTDGPQWLVGTRGFEMYFSRTALEDGRPEEPLLHVAASIIIAESMTGHEEGELVFPKEVADRLREQMSAADVSVEDLLEFFNDDDPLGFVAQLEGKTHLVGTDLSVFMYQLAFR